MSMNVGGYIRGPWWRYITDDEEKVRRCFVVAWGNVVANPSETYKDQSIVRFTIKTGRGAGRNEKHLNCVAFGVQISAVIMRAMERGDVVFCAGTWTEKSGVKTKKGVKPIYEMRVNFIVPLGLMGFLLDLYGTPEITSLVQARQDEDADPWEGD
ncbi:MAG: hypothetical protein IKD01_05270 [Oscillospiraceae bacterium]|nr:hypothetical protein [Oscillospiraceae bacterium]